MGDWIERLFNKHKLVRRAVLAWACGLTTYAVWLVKYALDNFPNLSDAKFLAVAGLVGTILVLVGTAIALYQWDKQRDKPDDS